MNWITRERIQVNRTATCWLIQLISRGFPLLTGMIMRPPSVLPSSMTRFMPASSRIKPLSG